MNGLLSGIVTSGIRAKLLVRFFSNPNSSSYLRQLAEEFGVSTNSVREELANLKEARLLNSKRNGREIHYRANQDHPLFRELNSIVKKVLGIDQLLTSIIRRLGNLEEAYLVGDYAVGTDSGIIDLVLIGDIDQANLLDLVSKTEKYIDRKIRTLVLTSDEYCKLAGQIKSGHYLSLWP